MRALLFLAISLFFYGIIYSQETLWGITSEGGEYGIGSIYKLNADGTEFELKHSFKAIAGKGPSSTKLLSASNGKLYGLTNQGGQYLSGVLFEFDPTTGNYFKIHDFDKDNTGAHPNGSLVEVSEGLFYGMTSEGGQYGKGVVFSYDLKSNDINIAHHFGAADGANPYGDLLLASDGKLYGLTQNGGATNSGVIFSYNLNTGEYAKLKDLNSLIGKNPLGSFTATTDGKLYAMTHLGASHSKGSIIEYDPINDTLEKIFDFSGENTGSKPAGNLLHASDGNLYGLTLLGGTSDLGVIFKYNPQTGEYTKLADFDNSEKGNFPFGSLFQATNGKIYGVTEQGLLGYGGIFEFQPTTSSFTNVYSFGGNDGASSRCSLIQWSDGNLYGMTMHGGVNSDGVLFKFNLSTYSYQLLLSFGSNTEGSSPYGYLVQAENGKLYGTTYFGGKSNTGVLFEYDVTLDAFKKITDFDFESGTYPCCGMIRGLNNKLYGLTIAGGQHGNGTIFEYDPDSGIFSSIYHFENDTGRPIGTLSLHTNGKIYGLTEFGGDNNQSVLYEFDPTQKLLTKKADLGADLSWDWSTGNLISIGDELYGLAFKGGANDKGFLYKYAPSADELLTLHDFNGFGNGETPVGSLILADNNKLYAVTNSGGSFNRGSLISFDPSDNSLLKIYDFRDILSEGIDITSGIIQSSNGKLYGSTIQGGISNLGVIYEYDLSLNSYKKLYDFTGPNGARPNLAPLIYINLQQQTITFEAIPEKVYGDQPFDLSAISSSGLDITFSSDNPAIVSVLGKKVTINGAGSTTITAFQKGNIDYHSSYTKIDLIIQKAGQIIIFADLPEVYVRSSPFELGAIASSGLPVSYASSNTNVASINGNIVTIKEPGETEIKAMQSGNENYLPADAVARPLIVNAILSLGDQFQTLSKLYPNPAKSELFLEVSGGLIPDHIGEVVFVDLMGHSITIPLEKLDKETYRINVQQLADGLYFACTPGISEYLKVIISQ